MKIWGMFAYQPGSEVELLTVPGLGFRFSKCLPCGADVEYIVWALGA